MRYMIFCGLILCCLGCRFWGTAQKLAEKSFVNETGSDYFRFTSNNEGLHIVLPHMRVGDTVATPFTFSVKHDSLMILVRYNELEVDTFRMKYIRRKDYLFDYEAPAIYRGVSSP